MEVYDCGSFTPDRIFDAVGARVASGGRPAGLRYFMQVKQQRKEAYRQGKSQEQNEGDGIETVSFGAERKRIGNRQEKRDAACVCKS